MEFKDQKTILVIDDDYYICDVLRTCLEAIAKLGVSGAIAKTFKPTKLFSEIAQMLGW